MLHCVTQASTHRSLAAACCRWRIWNVATGACELEVVGHTDTVRAIQPLPSGLIVTGSRDHTLRVWRRSGVCERVLTGHTDWVTSLALLPGDRIASGSFDSTARIWSTASWECLHTLRGHTERAYNIGMHGEALATTSSDKTVRLWNVDTGSCVTVLPASAYVYSLASLPDGSLATGGGPLGGVTPACAISLWQ